MQNKHIICFSGGESSALAALEVLWVYGKKDLILLNHDIHPNSEEADIKRFKREVATYIGVPITFANMKGWNIKDQFDVVVEAEAFKVKTGTALCTNRMKSEPFYEWLQTNGIDETSTIYYGFDTNEKRRILRRNSILAAMGYRTEFPRAWWVQTIKSTREIGIEPPSVYGVFEHANCVGCLKAGMRHWYVVYCLRPDVWERAVWAEDEIGYTIVKGFALVDLAEKFEIMKRAGVPANEKLHAATFWKEARRLVGLYEDENAVPCECVI